MHIDNGEITEKNLRDKVTVRFCINIANVGMQTYLYSQQNTNPQIS